MSSNNIIKYLNNVTKLYLIRKKINYTELINFVIIFAISFFILFNLKFINDESFIFEQEVNKTKINIYN